MATKSSTKSKPRSNRTAAAKAAKTRAANQEQLRRQREARGVLLIAAGVLLGVYLFVSGTGVLGAFLSELLFGLCGWFAYVLPVVLLAAPSARCSAIPYSSLAALRSPMFCLLRRCSSSS